MKVFGHEVPTRALENLETLFYLDSFTSLDVRQRIYPVPISLQPIDDYVWKSEVQNRLCQQWRKAGRIERDGASWKVTE